MFLTKKKRTLATIHVLLIWVAVVLELQGVAGVLKASNTDDGWHWFAMLFRPTQMQITYTRIFAVNHSEVFNTELPSLAEFLWDLWDDRALNFPTFPASPCGHEKVNGPGQRDGTIHSKTPTVRQYINTISRHETTTSIVQIISSESHICC